jgi:hypothetical protein
LRHERPDRDHGEVLLRREEHIALVEDREVELVRRDQLEAGRDVGRRLEVHREVLVVVEPVVQTVVEGDVIGVREPVERDVQRRRRRAAAPRSVTGRLVVVVARTPGSDQRRDNGEREHARGEELRGSHRDTSSNFRSFS